MRTRGRATGAAIGLLALVLAGCSGGDGGGDGGGDDAAGSGDQMASAPADEATDGATTDDSGGDAMGAGTVAVASTDLGDVLVDAEGMTLYMYDPDAQGASTCYDQCATAWPPLVTDGAPTAGDGADAAKLGTVERTDGTQQVTYNGWPLYYWAQDAAAGDTTGQAVNDVWWVLDSEGEPIRD